MGAGLQRELTRAEAEAVGVRVRDPQGAGRARDREMGRRRETDRHKTGRVDTLR